MTIEATRNKSCTKNYLQWSIHRANGANLLTFACKTCTGHFLLNQFSLRSYSLLNTYWEFYTDELIEWSRKNRVVLNPDKCKELRISFARNPEAFDLVSIDGNEIEAVNSAKLLGITISNKLTWNAHVNEVVKKEGKKLYFLVQLKRARLPPSDLVLFYLSCVRSKVDYGVLAFYNALPQYLKNEFVCTEKRALSIILPSMSYNKACEV